MDVGRDALLHCYSGDAFQRVVYTESHDEVANGKARVANEIASSDEQYADLTALRLNRGDVSNGLTGQGIDVFRVNDAGKLIAYRRFTSDGAGDDVVILVNFSNKPWTNYAIGFPSAGQWHLRINTDASTYSPDFGNFPSTSVEAASLEVCGTAGFDCLAAVVFAVKNVYNPGSAPQTRSILERLDK